MMVTFRERHGEPEVVEDDEPVIYHGEELTADRAEQLAQDTIDAVRRKNLIPGRKSLSGEGKHSPRVQFRVPDELREELDRRADAEHVSVSKIVRRALEEYLSADRGLVYVRQIENANHHGNADDVRSAVRSARDAGESWAVIASGLGLRNGAEAKRQYGDLVDH